MITGTWWDYVILILLGLALLGLFIWVVMRLLQELKTPQPPSTGVPPTEPSA